MWPLKWGRGWGDGRVEAGQDCTPTTEGVASVGGMQQNAAALVLRNTRARLDEPHSGNITVMKEHSGATGCSYITGRVTKSSPRQEKSLQVVLGSDGNPGEGLYMIQCPKMHLVCFQVRC